MRFTAVISPILKYIETRGPSRLAVWIMPKILMIIDLGHASPRFPGLCQELSEFGWEIDLITPRLSKRQEELFLFNEHRNWRIVETKFFQMRYKKYVNSSLGIRVLAKLRSIIANAIRKMHQKFTQKTEGALGSPDHAGWEKHVNREVKQLIKFKQYDLVLSSSSPITTHVIACKIARKLNTPWVADYRDLYSLNHTNPLGVDSLSFESNLVASAKALMTVSAGFARLQRQIYSGEIIVVNNGFKKLYPKKVIELNGPLKILYTGTIDFGFEFLRLFLNALEELNSTKVQAEITFLGSSCSDVRKLYLENSQKLPTFVHLKGNVSRDESIVHQRLADLLLYFEWNNPEIDGVLLTKLYEYVASGSAILRVGDVQPNEASKIFERIGYPESISTQKQIVEFLSQIVQSRIIATTRNDAAASYYSYAAIASRLDKDLRRLIGENRAEKNVEV